MPLVASTFAAENPQTTGALSPDAVVTRIADVVASRS